MTVLVANNNEHARGQIAAWLQADGYACTPTDIAGALTQVRQQKPDAVVIAVSRVDDGAMWVVRALCTRATAIGVVVMTDQRDFEVAAVATRLGAVDCLSGPPAAAGVVDAVRRAMLWRAAVKAATGRAKPEDTDVAFSRGDLRNASHHQGHHDHKGVPALDDTMSSSSAQAMLFEALDAHGPETYARAHRLAESAVALAHACNLSAPDTLDVWRAALLHTVGRTAPPGHHCEGGHPHLGGTKAAHRPYAANQGKALATLPALVAAARLVTAVNERVDGTGAPHGLMGNAIPVGARILAVANAYEDLTSADRLAPSSHDDAIAQLVRSAGTELDPDLVRAWIGLEEVVARCS